MVGYQIQRNENTFQVYMTFRFQWIRSIKKKLHSILFLAYDFNCHIAWKMRISEIQFRSLAPWESHKVQISQTIFYVAGPILTYMPGIDLQYPVSWDHAAIFFCLAYLQISFSYLNIFINLKEINYIQKNLYHIWLKIWNSQKF